MDNVFNPKLENGGFLREVWSRHPHVYRRLCTFWGSPEMVLYFETLLISDRDYREGFKPEVLKEIDFALNEHIRMFPKLHPEFNCPFRNA